MIKTFVTVELDRVQLKLFTSVTSLVHHFPERFVIAPERIIITQPSVNVGDDALQRLVPIKRPLVRLKRFGRATEVELTVLGCDRLVAGLCRGYLPIHLSVDHVDSRHPVARQALIDLLVLIRVGHAGERKAELVVDGSRVLAEGVSQLRRWVTGVSQKVGHGRVVKSVALSSENAPLSPRDSETDR
jgi:hypothetical protein